MELSCDSVGWIGAAFPFPLLVPAVAVVEALGRIVEDDDASQLESSAKLNTLSLERKRSGDASSAAATWSSLIKVGDGESGNALRLDQLVYECNSIV